MSNSISNTKKLHPIELDSNNQFLSMCTYDKLSCTCPLVSNLSIRNSLSFMKKTFHSLSLYWPKLRCHYFIANWFLLQWLLTFRGFTICGFTVFWIPIWSLHTFFRAGYIRQQKLLFCCFLFDVLYFLNINHLCC